MKRILVVLFASCAALPAAADEAQIRQVMAGRLGGVKIESVRETPVPGLFEVKFRADRGVEILYTDATATYVIVGNLYDSKSGRNLTTAIKFETLPLDLAVKVTRGSGRRVAAIFSDPYCPACKAFEAELAKIDDITIHYFMYPVIRPELVDHSKAVWCSKDRSRAWLELAQRGKQPVGVATCATPIEKVLELGRSLGIGSTPTVFLVNGDRFSGGLPAERLAALLDTAGQPQAKQK